MLDIIGEGDAQPRIRHGACDPVGRFFAGTDTQFGDPSRGALYRVDLDGTVGSARPGLTASAGMGWSRWATSSTSPIPAPAR